MFKLEQMFFGVESVDIDVQQHRHFSMFRAWTQQVDVQHRPFFFGIESVNIVDRCTTSYLLAGPACL